MKVHFVIVGESSKSFMNMTKLLLFSLRKNAGKYKDSSCTLVINGSTLCQKEVRNLQENFSPIEICSMPRLGSIPVANKFNAFYVLDKVDYDAMIFLDCDTVVLSKLDLITDELKVDTLFFSARPETNQVFTGFSHLVEFYGNLDKSMSKMYLSDAFPNNYPLYNTGVFVISKDALMKVREDAIKITYDLYERKKLKPIAKYYDRILKEIYKNILKYKVQPLPPVGIYYRLGLVEEIGLSLALIRNRVPTHLFNRRFNFAGDIFLEDEPLPTILHYMKRNFKIDRENLFTGDWINSYINSDSPTRKALANLVQDYITEVGFLSEVEANFLA